MNTTNPYKNSEGYSDPTVCSALSQIQREEYCIKHTYRPLVYICSPFAGDVRQNIENTRRYCAFAVRQMTIPIASHLLFPQFLDDGNLEERKLGLHFGKILLDRCEAVWVFGDIISEGMAAELERAKRRSIPVKHFNKDCEEIVD